VQIKEKPALVGRSILVIEDIPDNLKLFKALLNLEGAGVLEAERAQPGIELALSNKPDLILMDIHMPGMDGIAAARMLRENPVTASIPIVIITASILEEDRARALNAGCDAFLVKPLDPITFGQQLADCLGEAN
jgi:CheY-like chemotaxis protein